MSHFETIIGLEVHVQLNTKTKIFCSCPTSFGESPNINVCPTCLGLPGALPVLNREVVKKAIQFGTAIQAQINQNSIFARKNYFYPDLPKAYQISQFDVPIVGKGNIEIELNGKKKIIGITRAHMEEDAGKNIHEDEYSKVDLNRACTPLLEIVSEPDMRNSDEAIAYLKKLHSIVRFIGISDANMQEGSFRCDANVSIRPHGDCNLYTRVEIKNLNSFRFIQKAIEYEIQRQSEAWEDNKYNQEIIQETRLFDTEKGVTRSMRGKEESADYRYFPDPDLLNVYIDETLFKEGREIAELPDEKKERYIKEFGIKESDALVVTSNLEMANYFETMLAQGASPKASITWLTVELIGRLKGESTLQNCNIDAKTLSTLVKRIEEGKISGKSAKEILDVLIEKKGGDIDNLIESLGLAQINDDKAILQAIENVLNANADKVEEYKNGKDKLLGFFVGQVMKNVKGANPNRLNELLKEKLH
ncbi:Asp-tRNA(Asn)/Glu-tRNA(Gln) amidotransferase subunit GatB [Helicobacter sp. 13S00477-4]|uniref:Asp-tRNA(Asn)/Glu-tRNA(Gln) amidotransferase subunit GatB n=1 Tax=Helicobacter sp. 13S00477-4 TaxID=1905759 RepID=UPI000BA64EEB|nr:Asp-tRNA(Asn)/Glu-tRNA(Gln) amidotransferase subunit GatB [Helicobacter sp. 13S00477-4]PAF52280.1 aspartyl/glutamyl-tRNA amidotransferase subunit B [Helicobacter sp. 13S00477-4]